METKFFKETQKKMSVTTIKEFEQELRTKIQHELEFERKTNPHLSKVWFAREIKLWDQIRTGGYKRKWRLNLLNFQKTRKVQCF